MKNKPVYYSQNDLRWKYKTYSSIGDSSQTIGSSGCGPTCTAMVIQTLRHNGVTPVETCKWSVAHGYRTKSQGTDWSYFVPQLAEYHIPAHATWQQADAANALENGYMVIGRAKKGLWTSSGHYILAWKLENDTIYINDPNSTKKARSVAPYSTWLSEVTPMWVVDELAEGEEMRLNTIKEIYTYAPYAVEAIKHLCQTGILKGSGKKDAEGYPADLDLSLDMIRMFVINYRAGLY
jgi:hypothetical protein